MAMELEYDTLVLATGSYPFVPPIAGRDRLHCHVYRTIEDLGGHPRQLRREVA